MPIIELVPTGLDFAEGAALGTPLSGQVRLYAKTDGLFYSKDDAGVETPLGFATSGGPYVDFDEAAAPATPAAGKVRIYAKTDGLMYEKDDAGTETLLGSGGGGGMTNPMTTLGDLIIGDTAGVSIRLAGNTTTTKKFLRQTGTGSASAAPAWDTLIAGDLPDLSGIYQPLDGDLTAIGAIAGTAGLLKKTAANTWLLDTSTYATQAYADALVVGLLDDRGNFNASSNLYPSSGGSGTAGAILKGDIWTVSVGGTLGGAAVTPGDLVRALIDTPGQTVGNWAISETNIGYTPLNASLADGKIYIGNSSGIGAAVTPSGDVTISNVGVTAIGANKVTLGMMAQIATASVLGRNTGGTGNVEVLTTLPTAVQDNITRLGTIVSGVWSGSVIGVTKGGTGTSTQFTPGSIVFAGASGVYSQDNSNLYYDDTANRMGIGIQPSATRACVLELAGTNKTLDGAGNFGIFTTNSQAADLGGTFCLGGANGFGGIFDPWAFATLKGGKENSTAGNFSGYFAVATPNSGGTITEKFRITGAGLVGIGTGATISAKLHAISTSEQVRIGYDASNYAAFTVASDGSLTLAPTGPLLNLANTVRLQSANYVSQTTGWAADCATGAGDFRYLYTDELHAKTFIADLEQALAGGQIISKSVAEIAADFILPAAGAAGTLIVKDLPSAANMAVFVSGDIVRLRQFSRASGSLTIADAWGVVTSYVDNADGTQSWTFTRSSGGLAGTASGTISSKTLALDYGTSGNGFHEVNAIDGAYGVNSPYSQIVTWATHPQNGQTTRTRMGNLKGITNITEYGLYAGNVAVGATLASTHRYIRLTDTNFEINNLDLNIYNGGNRVFAVDYATPYLSLGATAPTGYLQASGYWVGKATAQAITWNTSPGYTTNVTVGAQNRITKTGGSGGSWDAGTSSVETFLGDGYVSTTAESAATQKMFGLSETDTNANFTSIKFAVEMNGSGQLVAYEMGTPTGVLSTYIAGTVLTIRRVGTTVDLLKDGASIHTYSATSSAALKVDTSISTASAIITGVVIGRFAYGTAVYQSHLGIVSGGAITSGWYWDGGSTYNFVGGGTFSGALSAATGTFAGALSAATGTFAGSLSAATGTFAGSLSAATGTFAGSLSAATGTFAGSLSAATGSFAGSLSAATGSFSGTITAAAGTIGGFSIGSDYVRDAANSFGLASTVSGGDDVRFWAGDTFANRATAPFRLTEAGALTATNVDITAGGGAVRLNDDGLELDLGSNSESTIKFIDATGSVTDLSGEMWATRGGGPANTLLQITSRMLTADSTGRSDVVLLANSNSGSSTQVAVRKYGASHATLADKRHIILSGNTIVDTTGTNSPAVSAALEILSTTGALLFPRLTTTQRDALTAVDGMALYNATTSKFQGRAGGVWVDLH